MGILCHNHDESTNQYSDYQGNHVQISPSNQIFLAGACGIIVTGFTDVSGLARFAIFFAVFATIRLGLAVLLPKLRFGRHTPSGLEAGSNDERPTS